MSEELEALKELRYRITNFNGKFHNYNELMGTIEAALEEKEKYDEILKGYGLELHDFREACFLLAQWRGSKWNYPKIEKQLKEKEKQDEIFRIIKKKEVSIYLLMGCDVVEQYNNGIALLNTKIKYQLSQTEFNSLKEYFK